MKNNMRSLNIATSVAIVLAESLKQTKLIDMDLEIKKDLASNWFKTLQIQYVIALMIRKSKIKFKSTSWKKFKR